MIKTLAILMLTTATSYASGLDKLETALNQVEAQGQHENVPVGDNGLAIGPFQIHKVYWQDAIEFDPSIGGSYQDCNGFDYSERIVTAYLERYGHQFIAANNWESLARIHNGGPTGNKKAATIPYWKRVQNHLK